MERSDVIILGGGLVGLTLAIALSHHGISAQIVDPMDPERAIAPGFDGRASAIASASWRMLDVIGVAEKLRPFGCAIHRIEVRDGFQRDALDFTTAEDDEPLGIMVENRRLRVALREKALGASGITLHMPDKAVGVVRNQAGAIVTLESGRRLGAPLILACEGRNSPMRVAAGIRIAHWKYDHVAIISAFDHAQDHRNVAHEIFFPAGPFALLPLLPGTRSALVWTVNAKDAPGILTLSDRAFLAEITKRAASLLGDILPAAPRSSFPLGFHHAAKITAERLALVGDAAHGIHPIAGQGLNLGFRDVAALVEVLVDGARLGLDLGDAQLMNRYDRWRSIDSLAVSVATDSLTRLFSIPGRPAAALRRFGLRAVQKLPPLKAGFMKEARGTSGDLPRLLMGEAV